MSRLFEAYKRYDKLFKEKDCELLTTFIEFEQLRKIVDKVKLIKV